MNRPSMSRLIINLLAFQVGWFASVLGAASGYPLFGPVVVSVVVCDDAEYLAALVALVFGATGGPISYLGGAQLGALQFVNTAPALIALAVGRTLATPLLIRLSQRFDGV